MVPNIQQWKTVIGLPKDDHGEKERGVRECEVVVSCSWIPNVERLDINGELQLVSHFFGVLKVLNY